MRLRVISLLVFLLWTVVVNGNNVVVYNGPRLSLNSGKDSVEIAFDLSWDNSWRDEFNWDAAWIFVKFKKENTITAWQHVYLGKTHVLASGLDYNYATTGGKVTGIFVYRNAPGSGHLRDKEIRLKAPLNTFTGVSAADIENNKVYVSVSAIETVLISYGAYYVGDPISHSAFREIWIQPEWDIIGTNSNYKYTASSSLAGYAGPAILANRFNFSANHAAYSWWSGGGSRNEWWMVDFGEGKTIRCFGVSGNVSYPTARPAGVWYLEGSNTNIAGDWHELWSGGPQYWNCSTTSYPVQMPINIDESKVASYRYYRIRMEGSAYPGNPYYSLQNIAMSEQFINPVPILIDGEGTRTLNKIAVPANYPKGYNVFYAMKYEVSQEQYVYFLNMLDYNQQKLRIGNNLDELKRGDYIFGDKGHPNARNGIAVFSKESGKPALFGNNLNPDEPFFAKDDGQNIACNFMTPDDMLAYCDWSGLRPMSELEFEKACRRPYPQLPLAGEYAWNKLTISRLNTLNDLVFANMESEQPRDIDCNVNAGNNIGPVRCGSFGSGSSTQLQAGSSFWGVMEMSGNLGELCYNIVGGIGFNASSSNLSHGDGVLNANGTSNVAASYWPAAALGAFAVRGGSYVSPDSCLQVSDRSVLSAPASRDSTVGFRGIRSMDNAGVLAGKLKCENGQLKDTLCPGNSAKIFSEEPATATGLDISYTWYMKMGTDDFRIVQGENGVEFNSAALVSTETAGTTYQFKRKATCLLGEIETSPVTIIVPNTSVRLNSDSVFVGACDVFALVTATPVMTPLNPPAQITWSYQGNEVATGTQYVPARKDFNGISGIQSVLCKTEIMGCTAEVLQLKVNIQNILEVAPAAVTMGNCGTVVVIDPRDQKRYCTVKIANSAGNNPQCWFAKNMDVGTRVTGDASNVQSLPGIQKNCYSNLNINCDRFGGLYRWEEALYGEKTDGPNMSGSYIQGICPDGWHIPSDAEWNLLETNMGGRAVAATGLKCAAPHADGTNASGFNGLFAGSRVGTAYADFNGVQYIWSSTANGTTRAMNRALWRGYAPTYVGYSDLISYGNSVRCILN